MFNISFSDTLSELETLGFLEFLVTQTRKSSHTAEVKGRNDHYVVTIEVFENADAMFEFLKQLQVLRDMPETIAVVSAATDWVLLVGYWVP